MTVLSQVTEASLGDGFGFYVVQFATVVLLALATNTSFGGLPVLALPALVAVMELVNRSYRTIGDRLALGRRPTPPRPSPAVVVVPVAAVSQLTLDAIAAGLSLGNKVIAVHVSHQEDDSAEFLNAWDEWNPGVPLVRLHDERRRLAEPVVEYLDTVRDLRVFVLIPEVEPAHLWQRALQNQRGAVLARALRRRTNVVVCRMRFRITPLGAH